jgi:glycosyltransferase involved in cell wall biosynthesis
LGTERRIVVLIRHFMVGGLERVILAQVPLLLDRGYDVTVAILEDGRDNALVAELDRRATVRVLSRNRLKRLRQLDEFVRGVLVLVHLGDGSLFPTMRPGLLRARRVIRFCHSDYSHTRSKLKNVLDRLLTLGEDEIVAVGGQSTRFLFEDVGVPEWKVMTLPNVAAPNNAPLMGTFNYRSGDAEAPLLVSIQSFYPHKAHEVLLAGFRHVLDENPRALLALVGDGSECIRLWEQACSLGVSQRIHWLGGIWNRLLVNDLLAQADIFVSMSRFEGVPISVLEARQHGLPLVLSDIPGHRDAGGSSARYVPVDDAYAFAAAVLDSLRDSRSSSAPAPSREQTTTETWASYADRFLKIVDGQAAF